MRFPGLPSRFEPVASLSAQFDLSVSLGERHAADGSPAGIDGVIEYATDLFDRASVEALAGRLVRLLEAAAADPERPIGALDILGAGERRTILRDWNATARAIPAASLPELFAAQAARTPDAVAVVGEEESLSYGELEARANRLAHHLRRRGVGPETVVGLCVDRSPAMVVGLLGILKAGGAYLPLDPGYPPERLAFMLADARAAALVSETALAGVLPPEHAAASVLLDADAPGHRRHARRPRRRSPSTRTTPPMSSTPPAPPEPRRASSSRMRASPTRSWPWASEFERRRPTCASRS